MQIPGGLTTSLPASSDARVVSVVWTVQQHRVQLACFLLVVAPLWLIGAVGDPILLCIVLGMIAVVGIWAPVYAATRWLTWCDLQLDRGDGSDPELS